MHPGVEGFNTPTSWSCNGACYRALPFSQDWWRARSSGPLERVFKVDAVKPTYRLALLTALAFLLVAPLPLQLHLGHPERSFEMYVTPHTS